MVSNLASPLHHPNTITQLDNIPTSKKRKLDADLQGRTCYQVDSDSKLRLWMNTRCFSPQKSSGIPSAWQPSLLNTQQADYLYSTAGTQKRSSKRSRETFMGLDLELNLTCGDHLTQHATKLKQSSSASNNKKFIPPTLSLLSPSPTAAEEEMVAAACKRCHLLVMLSKSYPACPNCKFMHPIHLHPCKPPSLMLA